MSREKMREMVENAKEENIPIQLAVPDPDTQIRLIYETKDLEESIAKLGQLQNVYAYKKDGKYYVFLGHRRYLAIKHLYEKYGKPDYIIASVLENEPDFETKVTLFCEESMWNKRGEDE